MNTCISKEINNGKLRISDGLKHDDSDEKNYEVLMITGNNIPVFLSCRKSFEDDTEKYIYDITSMTSLYNLAKIKSLTVLELNLLIESIIDCRKAIEDYLLSPEGLILDPEYVFFDRGEKKVKFCFFPWDEDDVYTSYTKMSEFLLSAIDYSDDKAVDIAYDIYASVLNKDYDFSKYIDRNEKIEDLENDEDTVETAELCTKDQALTTLYENIDNKKTLKASSIVCLTTLILLLILSLAVFIFSSRLFFYIMKDMRVISAIVLIFSILLYFPVMDIVSKS